MEKQIEINLGDVVQLKSGGASMTVIEVDGVVFVALGTTLMAIFKKL